jgi:hypothetical protein
MFLFIFWMTIIPYLLLAPSGVVFLVRQRSSERVTSCNNETDGDLDMPSVSNLMIPVPRVSQLITAPTTN